MIELSNSGIVHFFDPLNMILCNMILCKMKKVIKSSKEDSTQKLVEIIFYALEDLFINENVEENVEFIKAHVCSVCKKKYTKNYISNINIADFSMCYTTPIKYNNIYLCDSS